jgi:hypothetical protein
MRNTTVDMQLFCLCFIKGHTDHPLQELPVLTKGMVMENFDELVTERAIRLKELRAHLASDREGNLKVL